MPCLPGRYKLVELLCYVIMGFFPALVVLSMVSHPTRCGSHVWLEGAQSGTRDGEAEASAPADGDLRPGVHVTLPPRQETCRSPWAQLLGSRAPPLSASPQRVH